MLVGSVSPRRGPCVASFALQTPATGPQTRGAQVGPRQTRGGPRRVQGRYYLHLRGRTVAFVRGARAQARESRGGGQTSVVFTARRRLDLRANSGGAAAGTQRGGMSKDSACRRSTHTDLLLSRAATRFSRGRLSLGDGSQSGQTRARTEHRRAVTTL